MSAASEPVRGQRSSQVVAAARLHRARDRSRRGQTLLEGPHLLDEALAAGHEPVVVFGKGDDVSTIEICASHGLRYVAVDDRALSRLAGTKTPRGPVAVFDIPTQDRLIARGILVAWGVSDPGNAGTMIRTAAAFGWDFAYGAETADPWSPKVLRAAAGAHFRLGLAHLGSVGELRDLGYEPVAATPRDGLPPRQLGPGKYAVVVGEEAHGLPQSVLADCDHRVTIPMPGGTESLNAAIAAAILVYELTLPDRNVSAFGHRPAWV